MTTAHAPHTNPQAQTQEPAALAMTKAGLKSWWNSFTFAQRAKKEAEEKKAAGGAEPQNVVFGKPLKESLKYASVQISTANANGELYVWGYIPVVVAKCGLYLKENATEVEGTFRVSGSNKRMKELQAAFETPPRYGKDLEWTKEQFTTHDVASVFRRYLTQMPEPVIPHDMYHLFRDALAKKPRNEDEVIATYKRLIRSMPRANQYLLLYVLDLLSVFARKSDKNLMTAKNLAVIFRPALIAHPSHEMSPQEHQLSQDVLEFLIKHQDWFMLDIPPPPTTKPSDSAVTVPMKEPVADILASSDEESGGWKLISRDAVPKKIGRRRTTTERSGEKSPAETGQLSPVVEAPPSRSNSVVTVTRSRTLPSSKSGRLPEEERHAKLVKKQKRASVQPGRTASGGANAG
ncbi:Rho GTPase activation protein [Dichomitus squalens]|uniref:Rho GTPase activation protein n=1 Tax=Dichomitus squalens TaxID=114155 RepID=A0A4Q9N0W4_9APHY|nr:Rho GTPase activation protein [Dichomitus squalens LYAD-421 SS1]EJF64820.1 Rho GTPase activation protein [Dichomitus squalens LYAD-421 SS1]TBU33448.1 Rho GTPase activation protein [Dichomitus squalens]TBU42761.1 Rho GTPase activation protein [Dichomitus squalens]TBU62846.1 Rho GTPase activation protein [Dichomitus squalens]